MSRSGLIQSDEKERTPCVAAIIRRISRCTRMLYACICHQRCYRQTVTYLQTFRLHFGELRRFSNIRDCAPVELFANLPTILCDGRPSWKFRRHLKSTIIYGIEITVAHCTLESLTPNPIQPPCTPNIFAQFTPMPFHAFPVGSWQNM